MSDDYVPTHVLGTKEQVREAIAQDRRINAVAMETASQGAKISSLERRVQDVSELLGKIKQIETEVAGCFASLELMRKLYRNAEDARLDRDEQVERHHRVERRALMVLLVLLVVVLWKMM